MRRRIAGVYAAIGRPDQETDVWQDVETTGHKQTVLTPLLYRLGYFCACHSVRVLEAWLMAALVIVGVARRRTTTSRCPVPTARRPAICLATSSLTRPTAPFRSLSGHRPAPSSPILNTRSR